MIHSANENAYINISESAPPHHVDDEDHQNEGQYHDNSRNDDTAVTDQEMSSIDGINSSSSSSNLPKFKRRKDKYSDKGVGRVLRYG